MISPVDATSSLLSPNLSLADITLPHTVKLGVLASGSGSNLEAIAKAIEAGELNATIPIVVYNNPDAKVKARCDRLGIKCQLVDHRLYKQRQLFDQAVLEVLQEHGVEWVIMAGWMRIVTEVLINGYRDRLINIHPSLLPSFRGLNAVEQALAAQAKVTGCTVHFASLEVDSGPILMQAVVPIFPEDTSESLHARIQVQEHRIFPVAIAIAIQQTL